MANKKLSVEVGGLEMEAPELSLADHLPTPGAAGDALWAAVPQIVTASPVLEMIDALSERLPDFGHDHEMEL